MLNRASNLLQAEPRDAGLWDGARQVDQSPALRLGVLYAGMVLLLLVVGWRIAQIQIFLTGTYAEEFDRTTEKFESIPSPHGRIVSSDGQILAQDLRLIGVKAHYRWLEQPPQADWVRHQARAKLTRRERRDPQRLEAEMEQVRELHAALWERLAALTGISAAELTQRRAAVQKRVERMHAAVAAARERRNTPAPLPARGAAPAAWWEQAWRSIAAALTTPPQREREEPLVIQEELEYHAILNEITLDMAAEIESHPELYPGLRIALATRRTYPAHTLAPHLIGNRAPIGEDELKERRQRFPQQDPLDYQAGDWIGKSGLESYYERHLRGLRGLRRLVLNRRGEVLKTEIVRQPRVGRDLEVTLQIPLQRTAERLLDEALAGTPATEAPNGAPTPALPQGGCIIALDVRSGEVLVAACAPRFDLNLLVTPEPGAWQQILDDKRRPFYPRVTQMTLPPGSVFKTLTAAALLQTGRFDPDATIYCQGYLNHPRSHRCYTFTHNGVGHFDVNLTRALAESCNVYFFTAARTLGGPEPICEWARRFGFGQPTGIDLPGERGGNLPVPPSRGGQAVAARGRPWYEGDTLGLAIGQSTLMVTPLQIARLMAAVANGGQLVTPRLARESGAAFVSAASPDSALGNSRIVLPAARQIPDLLPGTLERVQEGLREVVANPRGTGRAVRLKEISIAGKTGTAEVSGRPDHAWFAGYVPADNPRYAFAVVLEHAGSGGKVAGPVARKLVEAMLAEGLLEPRRPQSPPIQASRD
jgi:penicillin-binding protein 2